MSERFDVGAFIDTCRTELPPQMIPIVAVRSIDAWNATFDIQPKPLSERDIRRRLRRGSWAPDATEILANWVAEEKVLRLSAFLVVRTAPKNLQQQLSLSALVEELNRMACASSYFFSDDRAIITCSMPFFGVSGSSGATVRRSFMDALATFCKDYHAAKYRLALEGGQYGNA